jgi:hypothetical protein
MLLQLWTPDVADALLRPGRATLCQDRTSVHAAASACFAGSGPQLVRQRAGPASDAE